MFSINQRVVCVNDQFALPPGYDRYFSAFPVKDKVYTIRDILPGQDGEVACHLNEIRNPINLVGVENGYSVERFAPLEEEPAAEAVEQTLASLSY